MSVRLFIQVFYSGIPEQFICLIRRRTGTGSQTGTCIPGTHRREPDGSFQTVISQKIRHHEGPDIRITSSRCIYHLSRRKPFRRILPVLLVVGDRSFFSKCKDEDSAAVLSQKCHTFVQVFRFCQLNQPFVAGSKYVYIRKCRKNIFFSDSHSPECLKPNLHVKHGFYTFCLCPDKCMKCLTVRKQIGIKNFRLINKTAIYFFTSERCKSIPHIQHNEFRAIIIDHYFGMKRYHILLHYHSRCIDFFTLQASDYLSADIIISDSSDKTCSCPQSCTLYNDVCATPSWFRLLTLNNAKTVWTRQLVHPDQNIHCQRSQSYNIHHPYTSQRR